MKKGLIAIIIGILILSLGLVTYVYRGRFDKKPAGLEINTSPTSRVYLNGEDLGTTPFQNEQIKAGSYTIKLVPDGTGTEPLYPWETTLDLVPQTTTVINKTFSEADTDSSSSVLILSKEPGNDSLVSVISDPDTVSLNIDGEPHGFTPITKLSVTEGEHAVTLSSPGYKSQELTIKTSPGYNLLIKVKLGFDTLVLATPTPSISPSPEASSSASPSPSVQEPYVLVKETGTGWLRVRSDPSATSDELGKADVGSKLPYLETSENGWYKVTFQNQPGWISAKYGDLVK